MNFKKLKRMLSIVLSATMILSTNMTGLAVEVSAPEQENHEHDWQLDKVLEEATADEEGMGVYVCNECGETQNGVINPIAPAADEDNTETEHQHSLKSVPRVAPTCWKEGTIFHYTCQSCGKIFLEAAATTELTEEDLIIDKLDHQPLVSNAVAVTCTTSGYREYYYCSKCDRKYESLEKFAEGSTEEGTDGTDWFSNKESFKIAASGHNYNGLRAYAFNWGNFDASNFAPNEANGITATRTCGNAGCNHAESGSVSVVKTVSANYDCVKGGDVTYTATATFDNDNMGQSAPVQNRVKKTDSKTIAEVPENGAHDYEVKFDWNGFLPRAGADNKLVDYTIGVTAKRVCRICHAEDTSDITVTVNVAEDESFKPAEDEIPCDQNKTIRFTASVPGEGDDAEPITDTKPYTINKTNHQITVVRGTKASCETKGTQTYYECGRCQGKFWDENAASPFGQNDTTDIDPLGHSFGIPEFSWENPATKTGKAQATFKCIRSGCTAQVTISNLDVSEEGVYLQPDVTNTCGNTVTLSYEVSVPFDRLAVKKQNGSYIYDTESVSNAITYRGYVEKDAVLTHEFEKTIAWNSQADADGVYDAEQGVTVTLTCKTCGGVITCNSATGTVRGSGTLAATTGSITFGNNDNASSGETCTEAGRDVYDITIKCDTKDATNKRYDITDQIVNVKPATGHSYSVSLSNWDGSLDDNNNPTGITATLTCSEGDSTLSSSQEGVSISFEPTTDLSLGYAPATCTTAGTDVWKVTISYGDGKTITEDGNGDALHIFKNTPKRGHTYGSVPAWDWSEYGHADPYDPDSFIAEKNPGDVYATYTCTNPSCDGLKDTADTTQAAASGPNSAGRWVRKMTAAVTKETGTDATCTQNGTLTIKAAYGENTDAKSVIAEATGHELDTSTVIWGAWEKVTENGQEVMQEVVDPEDSTKTYSVPVYRITASLKCKNANCPLANKMLSVTGRSDRKLTGNDKQNNYVEVTVAHTPNTCEEPGKTVYTAAAGFFDKDQAITFKDRSDTLSRTDVKLATGHDYEFTWVWKGTTADGKTDVTVTDENEADIVAYTAAALTRTCKNDPKDSKTIEAEKVDVTKDPANAEDVSCTQGVIAYYDAEVTFDKTETDPGTKYADRKVIVKEALGHKYGWIINEDWESISGETTGVKAYYGCMNKIPEDVWTDDTGKYNDYNIQDVNIVKNTAQSSEPTCSTKGATVWDLQVADGTVIGSHEQTIDIVPTAHKAQGAVTIQWETLKAIDRDANGKVIFSVKGKRACAYGNHTLDIEGRATAELGSFSCGEAATVECTFDFGTGIEVEGGQKQPLTIEAAGHDLEFVEGTEEKVCGQPYYPDHFRCKKCGKAFLNPSPNSETVISTTANLPHGFGTPVFSWIEQGKTAQAVFTCANCGTTRQFTADVGSQLITKRPTCQTTGTAYYPVDLYLTSLEDKSGFSADYYPGNVIETLPVIGHEFDSEGNCIYGCGKKSEDIVNVIYVNGLTDNVIRDTWIQRSTAAAYEIQAAPNQFGYDLAGWRFNNTSYASTQKTKLQTDVRTAITNTETNEIRIYVQYTAAEKSATVNVYQVVNGTAGQTPIRTISDLTVGQVQLLSADEAVGGAVFSHWAADDKGIQVLSVSRNYNLFISGEGKKNVYAIYVTNPDEEMDQKRIVISDVYTSQIDGADKLSFVSAMSMPEGATWVSSGFMYSTSSTFGTDKEVTDPEVIAALTVGSTVDGVKQKALTGRTANVLTINLSVNNSTNKGRDVWVRGYLFYEDSEGNLHECYTDVVKTNYTTVKTQEEN